MLNYWKDFKHVWLDHTDKTLKVTHVYKFTKFLKYYVYLTACIILALPIRLPT